MNPPAPSSPPPFVRGQIAREAAEMVLYAFASGLRVPASVVATVERYEGAADPAADLAPLVQAHNALARIVAPATPRSIAFMAAESERRGRWGFLSPVAAARRMMGVGLVCTALFILISLSKKIDGSSGARDIFDAYGMGLLVNEVFWLASAGVGASFAMLYQMNEYIVGSTYDPRHEASYWLKLVLGIMAGFILAVLVPLDGVVAADGVAAELTRPTLALVGGYSASVVYRILNRLVDAVESVFRGDAKDDAARREQAAASKATDEAAQQRLGVAGKLVDLQHAVAAGIAPDELTRRLRDVVATLVPVAAEDGAAPSASTPPADASAVTVPTHDLAGIAAASGTADASSSEAPAEDASTTPAVPA